MSRTVALKLSGITDLPPRPSISVGYHRPYSTSVLHCVPVSHWTLCNRGPEEWDARCRLGHVGVNGNAGRAGLEVEVQNTG